MYNLAKVKNVAHRFELRDGILVRRSSGKVVVGTLNSRTNYYTVDGVLVHVLVWFLSGGEFKRGFVIDHASGNRANNVLNNLRSISRIENAANTAPRKKRSRLANTRFKGVFFYRPSNKWRAIYCVGRRQHLIGYFSSEIEAAKAYNAFALAMSKQRGIASNTVYLNPIPMRKVA